MLQLKKSPGSNKDSAESEINEYSDPVPSAELGSEMTALSPGPSLFHVKLVLIAAKARYI